MTLTSILFPLLAVGTACDTLLQTSSIADYVRDRSVILDTTCTYRVPSYGISDQGNSGRCWMFSTLNILRSEIAIEGFHFSACYLQFYDLLEKCNTALEKVIEYREEPLDSRFNQYLFSKPLGDGGNFEGAAHLIEKYGLVPDYAMPETYASSDNTELMNLLRKVVRKYGLALRDTPEDELDAVKSSALADVCRILVLTLGQPPSEFLWEGQIYTPMSFKHKIVLHDMENDYFVAMNEPTLEYYKTYCVKGERNCHECRDWTFLNLPMSVIDSLGVASLKGGRMFYVSADTMHDNLQSEGIYDLDTFSSLDSLLGISSVMDKCEQFLSLETKSVHAVAVCGVKLGSAREADIRYWLVQNSFGYERGAGGFVTFSEDWLDKYLYRFVVEKRFVPDYLIHLYSQQPQILPAWTFGY